MGMLSLIKIAKLLGLSCSRHLPISETGIDSRTIAQGGLFFALKGERNDGHDFLCDVAKRGAFAAVVSKDYQGPDFGLVLLPVDDVLESMHYLAKEILRERKTRVIGVTGSVGKTTTKEFLFQLLCKKYKVHKNPKSFNSQRTLPLVIMNAKGNEDYLLLEMAMTEKGHIAKLVEIAAPTIVVLTPIALAHAKAFTGLDDIGSAKGEIFSPQTEFAVIHAGSYQLPSIQKACKCKYEIYPKVLPIKSPFKETHFTENFAAAFAIAKYLGLTDQEIELRSQGLKTIEHRFEKKLIQGITYIDDSYNANPTSMRAALMNLPSPKGEGKRIAVLGAMVDLASLSYTYHKEVGEIALQKVDELFCIGEECRPMVEVFSAAKKPVRIFNDYAALTKAVIMRASKGDVVLIKGSNYHKLWEIFDEIEKGRS